MDSLLNPINIELCRLKYSLNFIKKRINTILKSLIFIRVRMYEFDRIIKKFKIIMLFYYKLIKQVVHFTKLSFILF